MIRMEWYVEKCTEFRSLLLIYFIFIAILGVVLVIGLTSLAQNTQPLGIVSDVDWVEITHFSVTAEERRNANFVAILTTSSPPYVESRIPGWFCSGFLVGPDLLMTAAHCLCVWDEENNRCEEPKKVDEDKVKKTIAVFNYEEDVELSQLDAFWCNTFVNWDPNPDSDVALLRCKRGPIGFPTPVRPGEHRSRGFADLRDFDRELHKSDAIYVIHQNCVDSTIGPPFTNDSCAPYKKLSRGKLLDLVGTNLYHDADTLPGSSGAPIFSKATHRIVGMHKGWALDNGVAPGDRNGGTRASALLGFFRPLRAVTDPHYDDIGSILKRLNYTYIEVQDQDLADYNYIKDFDAIFINCSGDSAANAPAAKDSLRRYVEGGGVLYASDWAFVYLQESFPGHLFFSGKIGVGNQHVTATITDPGLELYLMQKTVEIFYNLGSWAVMTDVSPGTEVIMRGDVRVYEGISFSPLPRSSPLAAQANKILTNVPLAASFEYEKGFVIYTTFHNEPQLTELQRKLLEYFIIKPITAKIAKWLGDKLEELGHSVKQKILNVINKAGTKIFSHVVDKIKDLIIALGFEGSRFRVSVYRPDGSLYAQVESETSPIIIKIPNAKPGEWSFTVEALDVPYDNYPFVVMVGESVKTLGVLFFDDLEPSESPGWDLTKGNLWHVVDESALTACTPNPTPFPSSTHAWYYGNEGNCSYYGNGILTSPLITIPGGTKKVILSFDYFLLMNKLDKANVQVSFDGGRRWRNVRWYSRFPTQGSWVSSGEIPLYLPRGATGIMIRFSFTRHIRSTGGIGWFIDNISLAVPLPLRIMDETLPEARLGQPYSHTMTAEGGTPPYTWSARGLPVGLRMNTRTSVISGIPRRSGTYTVTITARDRDRNSVSESFVLVVSPSVGALEFDPLQVFNIEATPSPAKKTVKFIAEGTGIQNIGIEIFNLAGAKVFGSGWVQNGFSWHLQDDQGQIVANGVYFYVVTVRGWDGTILKSKVQKLIILR